MSVDHTTEYDGFATQYAARFLEADLKSREKFWRHLPNLEGKHVLDIGCGEGTDVAAYTKQGARAVGIDPSASFIDIARKNNAGLEYRVGVAEQLPFANATFDVVTSVYALQNTTVPQALSEIGRVLRPGGTLLYLSKHPLRQFLEKGERNRNYFTREMVTSNIFDGAITLTEPSHTMSEYCNPAFLNDFRITHFEEDKDFPASEQRNGDDYPCYFIMKAVRD